MSSAYDLWLQAPVADEPSDTANTALIEEMAANPDCFDSWLSAPSSVRNLLAMLLDRGLPRMDESETDDALRDAYDMNIETLREDFRMWAENQDSRGRVPVDDWRDAA